MRKFNYLSIAVIGLTAMFSCQTKEIDRPIERESKIVHFHASELETKTAFGERTGEGKYPTLWTENDSKVKVSLNYAAAKDAVVNPSDDFKTASFNASIEDDETGSYTFYALSPSTAQYAPYSSSTKTVGIEIPSTQTTLTNSVDEAAQILVAKSETFDEFPEGVELSFSHAVAYGRMSLVNLNLGTAVISSVSLTSSENFAGRYSYSPDTGEMTEISASKTITVNTSSASDIWFACAPVDLSDGGTLDVVVNTDKGTFTRPIVFPADKGNFVAGHVAKFSVNMQGISLVAPEVYTLVKSKSELTVDSEVIIVASTEDFAISTTQNSNNRGQAGVTKTGETINSPAGNVQVFNLVVGNKDNTAAFKVGEEYLYSVSGKNYLRTGYFNDAASWNISVSPEGIATINNYANTAYNIKYNASDRLFSCYTTAQTAVCIYKKNGSGTSTQLFKPELAVPVLNVTADNSTKVITVAWTDVANATGYDVVCGEKQTSVNSGVQTASFTMDSYGTFDVSVTAKAEGYLSATALDKVTLTDPNADEVYYVKVTSAPADWSGKYLVVYETTPAYWDGSLQPGTSAGQLGSAAGMKETVIIDGNKIAATTLVMQSQIVIEKVDEMYALKLSSGKYIGQSEDSNGLKSDTKNNAYLHTITLGDDKTVTISSSDGYTRIAYNKSSNFFRYYRFATTAGYPLPTLYKLQDN